MTSHQEHRKRLNYKLKHLDEDDEEEIEEIQRDLRRLYFRERASYATDLIQPDDNRFKEVYKEQWLKLEKEKEEAELKAKSDKESQEKFLHDNRHGVNADMAKRFIKLEEKIKHG